MLLRLHAAAMRIFERKIPIGVDNDFRIRLKREVCDLHNEVDMVQRIGISGYTDFYKSLSATYTKLKWMPAWCVGLIACPQILSTLVRILVEINKEKILITVFRNLD